MTEQEYDDMLRDEQTARDNWWAEVDERMWRAKDAARRIAGHEGGE
jgi:hypothetical protein